MQQPELGQMLSNLRKEKNLTQEELVEKSNVSVRTIQRIEAGEVLPRISTVKILIHALGENYNSFLANHNQTMKSLNNSLLTTNRNTLLVAILAGMVYLVVEIILGTMDIEWIMGERNWGYQKNLTYTCLIAIMVISFSLFAQGFITLGKIFENRLLIVVAYLLIIATLFKGILDVTSLSITDFETLWIPYATFSLLFGALSIAFGIALIRLQDGMGELSRIAGVLEIIIGCLLVTVVLFFATYVIMIPAIVLEIILLYRGYEYLMQQETEHTTNI